MNLQIEIEIKSRKWRSCEVFQARQIEEFFYQTCKKILTLTDLKKFLPKTSLVQLCISLISDSQIKKINQKFRKKNKPTDILSFSALDEKIIQKNGLKAAIESDDFVVLGDLVLAFETIISDAKIQQKIFENHLTHMLIHGILHLLGYDHEDSKMAEEMEELEIKILKAFKITNPYISTQSYK